MTTIFEDNYKNIDQLKTKSKKFRVVSRYLEELIINSSLDIIDSILNSKNKEYVKLIGGIGHSRVLQFCVTKLKSEDKIKEDIEFIISHLKKLRERIKKEEVVSMLNCAIVHEKYEVVDFIFSNKDLMNKVDILSCDGLIIKNLLMNDIHNLLTKRLIVEEKIKVDKDLEEKIDKYKNDEIKNFVKRYKNYKNIMENLEPLRKERRVKI